MAQKAHSLSHTKWMCKYHIVFTPKYRRKSFIINIEVVWEKYSIKDKCFKFHGLFKRQKCTHDV